MSHTASRRLACALGIAFTTIAAAAPPAAIDSEKKAGAAVLAAMRIKGEPSGDLLNVSSYARGRLEEALLQIAAATTPAALMNSRNGVTLPCANGGTLTARMARSVPRVLRLSWDACKFTEIDHFARERRGTAEAVLLSDSFTPDKVGAIRFGTASSDFVDKRLVVYDDQITDEARSLNLRMVGLIPMRRAFPLYGLFVGDFAYEITGFFREHDHVELPGSPIPPFDSDYRIAPENLFVSGATTYNSAKTHAVEDTRLHVGKVSKVAGQDGYPDSVIEYRVDGLKVRRETDFADYNNYVMQESLDGRIDFHYPAPDAYSAGCLSGEYTFKTRAPIVRIVSSPHAFESGDLLINGSTVAQFYTANQVPAGLPVPVNHNLVHLEVANVGAFNYDTNGVAALREIAQCWN